MSAPIETLHQYEGQSTSGTLDLRDISLEGSPSSQGMATSWWSLRSEQDRWICPTPISMEISPRESPSSQGMAVSWWPVRSEEDRLVCPAVDIQQVGRVGVPTGPLKRAEFFLFTPSELQQERVLKSLLKKVDIVTDEAEFELLRDDTLFIGVDKILDRIISELNTEDIDCSVALEVFHDMEVENWDSFKITIKSKDPTIPHKRLLELWDKFSLSVLEETNKLKSQGEITESEQSHIQSKLIISVEVG